MSLLRGNDLVLGFGIENPSARGTAVEPVAYLPGRAPSGITVEVTKALLKETNQAGISSSGSVVVQRKASGALEFNLRSETIGYLLKSLLGYCTTSTVSGDYKKHAFTILANDPQFPTLTLALAQAGAFQDYKYKNALVTQLNIKTPVDDLVNGTADFIASDEETHSAYSVSYSDDDYYFRPQDVSIKIADDIAGLSGATPINVKELELNVNNNGRSQQHIGSVTPTDNIAGLLEITGNLVIDYEATTYHDLYKAGTYKAVQITMERTDVDLGGGKTPKLDIILAKVSFEASTPERPLDDIVQDKLSFTVHYSEGENAIEADLYNEIVDYDYEPVS